MTPSKDNPIRGFRPLMPGGDTAPAQVPVSPPVASAVPARTPYAGAVSGPPVFQQAPREYVTAPQSEQEIQPPPHAPSNPGSSLVMLLLPSLGMITGLAISIFVIGSRQNMSFLFLSAPMMLFSLVAGLYGYVGERVKFRRTTRQRNQSYHDYLETRRQAFTSLVQQQCHASLITHPDLNACLTRVEQHNRRLWERSPGDSDFLDVRLGCGEMPATFTIKAPPQTQAILQPDPLVTAAQKLAGEFATVSDVAITLPLAPVAATGLAGSQAATQNILRAILLQLATHHAPTDLKIVLTIPELDRSTWEWVRWLPHTWNDDRTQRFVAANPDTARTMLTELTDVLKQRQLQRRPDQDPHQPRATPVYLFIFADPMLLTGSDAACLGPLLQLLLTAGPAVGAYTLFLANRPEAVRKECGAVIDLTGNSARLCLVGPPSSEVIFSPDTVDTVFAERLARSMAPLRLHTLSDGGDLPALVTLLDMLGVSRVECLPVLDLWRNSEPFRSLAAPIGICAGNETIYLDFHEKGHGPHGLQAGATGSGKSELLQSLIASIAVHYHPHEVAFVLIDYKGGGMANVFRDLPHQIGTITNLAGSMATRALAALRAELQRRQHLFDQTGVNHIDDYLRRRRQGQVGEPLPHLIIIADEFAELAQNQPDFMSELISAVRVGRSLGIHLLLATQKPAGVVNEQIWGNTRFRVSLRVERPEDSQEILKRPDAATIRRPGHAYFQVGMNEVFEPFQAAWGGAAYNPATNVATNQQTIAEVELDGTRRVLNTAHKPTIHSGTGQTQLQALIAHIAHVARQNSISRTTSFWLPPLPETVVLNDLYDINTAGWNGQAWQPVRTWLAPIIGQVDDPAQQFQGPLRLNLGKEGHLAVFGAPGSGKTILLQTFIAALAIDHTPAEVNIYALDFGGRMLKQSENFPHVGGVILPDEVERLNRLINMLVRELDSRKNLLVGAGVGTLAAYRTQAFDGPPAIVIMLDNYTEFANTYPDLNDTLIRIAREGGSLGIHLILTASMVNAIPMRMSSNIALAIALELNDPSEYSIAVGRTNGLLPARGVRGRGLVRDTPPLEFQTALPSVGATDVERTTNFKALMRTMASAWTGPVARPIPMLPQEVALSNLITPEPIWMQPAGPSVAIPIGLETETLEPSLIELEAGPHFLITGPPASGKTTLLQTWLLALAERFSPQRIKFYFVSMGHPLLLSFRQLPHTAAYVEDDDRLGEMIDNLSLELDERREALNQARRDAGGIIDEQAFMLRYPALVVVIDDFDQFQAGVGFSTKGNLEALMKRSRGLGFHLLVAGPSTEFAMSFDSIGKILKDAQTGFLLGSSDHNDIQLFNLRLPMEEAGKSLPPGRCFFARRGRYYTIQAATCHSGTPSLVEWITRISGKSST